MTYLQWLRWAAISALTFDLTLIAVLWWVP